MSGKLITATPTADLLVEEIVDRYGSIAQFCDLLRRDLDDPTVELPCIPMIPRSQPIRTAPPHPYPPARRHQYIAMRAEPVRALRPAVEYPAAADRPAEANRRRGFWRRFIARWCP